MRGGGRRPRDGKYHSDSNSNSNDIISTSTSTWEREGRARGLLLKAGDAQLARQKVPEAGKCESARA